MSVYMCVCCDTCGETGELSAAGEYPAGWGKTDKGDHCAFHEPEAMKEREKIWRENERARREAEARAKAWDEQPIRRMLTTNYPKFPLGHP